ncbi:MAG: UDP-N-acetylmuramoyl-tripeptide--D-alanyl-D-alanine ligase [Marinovum sp.]|nr:UDP-N-acetylmuramoyl-tripeptide--D-alanyl-D-alanine ligase [Marinovum sp.]
MSLWTAEEAVAATGGRTTASWSATGVSIDTRTLAPGDLFVALKAARDGHDFVTQALEAGAAAALVSRIPDGVAEDAPLLVVKDVLTSLEALGAASRARTHAKVVAVTGSVGKTSTKEMLRAMLGAQGKTHAAEASYNNHWGVPLTLARMPADSDYAVIEIGMNHPGEIAPLAKLTRPHVAMVTIVAAAHLEAFENLEGIAREKASILEGLVPGGTAVLNADLETSPVLAHVAEGLKVPSLWFGESAEHYCLRDVVVENEATMCRADTPSGALLFKVQSPGRHFAMNALAALAATDALGADIARSATALSAWQPFKGRGVREQIVVDPGVAGAVITLIDDSYNANPTSVAAALDVLAASEVTHDIGRVSRGRRIAVLGDMKELGHTEVALHQGLSEHAGLQSLDVVHCVGPLMAHLHAELPDGRRGFATDTSVEMAERLPATLDAGDVVMVKGSLSTGLARVVDAIRKMREAHPNT